MKIGRITFSPAVTTGRSEDKNTPEIDQALTRLFEEKSELIPVLVSDPAELRAALLHLCDEEKCQLIVTTGGTGPGLRDITPETTRQILDRELPGFGEIMRHYSYESVRTAILSRATAGIRSQSLIVNLPGRARAAKFCLRLIREAIVECLEHTTGERPVLFVDPIEIPIFKIFPFLKFLQPKPDPRDKTNPRPPLKWKGL